MRFSNIFGVVVLGLASTSQAAKSWSFEDATVAVAAKGAAEPSKQKLTPGLPFTSSAITLSPASNLKVALTTTEGSTGKKAHQAFLTLREVDTGLEESFAFSVKESGKGKVDLAHKDLPIQFLTSAKPLRASIVIASFGSSVPYNELAFTLKVENDAKTPPTAATPPERYTSKPEIHHKFRDDPRSPPTIISAVFALAILATIPALLGAWGLLGGNLGHAGKAFGASPIAHSLFFGSILAMEGVFFMYYASWNLFQTLPVAGVVGVVAYVSGSRALTEVQDRRLAGER